MATFLRDLRYAARSLRASPGLTTVALVSLALGIGVNSAMFSIANGILWRSLPVRDGDRLAVVYSRSAGDDGYYDWSYADYRDFRDGTGDVFESMIAYYPAPLSVSRTGAESERSWGEVVSANFFDVLGVPAERGRMFLPEEEEPGAAPAAVISHGMWRRRFQSDPGVVGRTLELNGHAFTVVGVAPEAFHGVYYVGFVPDLWVPAGAFDLIVPGGPAQLDRRGATTFRLMGRLRPGVTALQAQAATQAVARRLAELHPETNTGIETRVLPEQDARPEPSMARGFALAAWIFLGLVGLVLLVACANLANLLLARAAGRRKEIALRVALGASRWRLVRQLLTESALLGLLGGGAGLVLAVWATRGLSRALQFPTDITFAFDFGVDGSVLVFTFAISLFTGLLFGLAPALRSSRPDLAGALKGDRPASAGRRRRVHLGAVLVVGQVAVSSVLLVCAGLAVRTLGEVGRVDPGFDVRNGLLVSLAPGLLGYGEADGQAFYRRLLQRVEDVPGVRSAALADYVPLEFSSHGGTAFAEGREQQSGEQPGDVTGWSFVTPGYFGTIGTPLLEGRDFQISDDSTSRHVVVVNETFARRAWPGRSPIGRTLRLDSPDEPPVEVVGVARDGKYRNLTERPQPYLYLPLAQSYQPSAALVVRAEGDPLALLPALREAVRELDPAMPLFDVKTLERLVSGRSLLTVSFAAGLAGVFGLLALALAAVGLYGVVSYAVSRRVREIGIRMALGAPAGLVLGMVVRSGLALAGTGLAIGLGAALAVTRFLSGLLYGVSPTDPPTFAAIAAVLAAVALLASWVPARRATRVDPLAALRTE